MYYLAGFVIRWMTFLITTGRYEWMWDLNMDGAVNAVDLQIAINILLG